MKKTLFGLATALAIVGASSIFIGASRPEAPKAAPEAAPAPQPARVKWEYKTAAAKGNNVDEILKQHGDDGWELAAMVVTSSGLTFSYNLAFKRPAN